MFWVLFIPWAIEAAVRPKPAPPRIKSEIRAECTLNPIIPSERHLLGKGGFSRVYREDYEGKPVAIKEATVHLSPIIAIQKKQMMNGQKAVSLSQGRVAVSKVEWEEKAGEDEKLLNEMKVWQKIAKNATDAPACLMLIRGCYWRAADKFRAKVGFVMELIEGIDLEVASQKGNFSDRQVARVMANLVPGVALLHRLGILHRDIKPANIMVTMGGQVKLIDFGMAQFGTSTRNTDQTPAYASPECLLFQPNGQPHDCWCLAATAFKLRTGLPPLYLIPNVIEGRFGMILLSNRVIPELQSHVFPKLADHLAQTSPSLQTFILSTLQLDPAVRPAIQAISQHPLITEVHHQATDEEMQTLL